MLFPFDIKLQLVVFLFRKKKYLYIIHVKKIERQKCVTVASRIVKYITPLKMRNNIKANLKNVKI